MGSETVVDARRVNRLTGSTLLVTGTALIAAGVATSARPLVTFGSAVAGAVLYGGFVTLVATLRKVSHLGRVRLADWTDLPTVRTVTQQASPSMPGIVASAGVIYVL